MIRCIFNILAVLLVLGSALAYDTTPMPLWLAALDFCALALLFVQLLPDADEVSA